MPEGVGYGPQTTASTGLSLNYVGKQVYAYSGVITLTSSFADYFNFTTGKETIICDIQVMGDWDSLGANNIETKASLNGTVVIQDDSSGELAPYVWPCPLVIPPYTQVKIEGKVQAGTIEFTCVLTGKIVT